MSRRFGLPGKVYFVEAVSSDLLTEQASNILRRAEVVFYDELVAPGTLDSIPTSTLVLRLDKGHPPETSPRERMIAYADEGKIVVRLFGPNQLFSGRIEQEMRAIHEADVSIEVIPAATESAAAATAS